ncbi:hypothetical protein A3844_01550 [Paenibacillus helianthi]|uniref:Schlafen AlbA-2 domain-containing protein n=1 Tax=Paenibacillus helianthi TaxID=1349432 RepID=A0ABX3EY94_9BACL|nr:ATP-binding protein [Paenibacillus helianthi]OKP91825.1 hypothetical protein A3844_01550 [Paenibacillus helianthi]
MNSADYLFDQFNELGLRLLNKMKEDKQEEGLFLDFKNLSAPHIPGAGKTEREKYAQAISGYSNSSGGIIVWGIDCRSLGKELPDVFNDMKPIKNLRKFLTDLKNFTHQATDPINNKVQNIPLFINETEDSGFVVTFVPESDLGPHRSQVDNEYYTRIESSFKKMSHTHIADMFGKRQRPNLQLDYQISASGNVLSRSLFFRIHFFIKNNGRYLATYPALQIKSSDNLTISEHGVDGWNNFNLKLIYQNPSITKERGYLLSGGINDVIHPNSSIEVCMFLPSANLIDPSLWYGLNMSEKIFNFTYTIFAEGMPSIGGTLHFDLHSIVEELRKLKIENIDHLESKLINE